jgi:hypothetical protein
MPTDRSVKRAAKQIFPTPDNSNATPSPSGAVEDATPNQYSWLRRTDVALRARYPNLVTRLFEVVPHQFQIVFDKSLQDADAIREEFANRIRPITLFANVSNVIPDQFLREIEPIPDDQLARAYEGFPFRAFDVFNLLAARFPELPIVAVRDGGTPMKITVYLERLIDAPFRAKVEAFCAGLGAPAPFELIVADAGVATQPSPDHDPIFISATRLRRHVPSFARRDEAFWFDNLDQIYAGAMSPDSFPGVAPEATRCFMDLTLGGEHLNLRQAIMLYDQVYCAPPLAAEHANFLTQQGLTEHDLLFLIEKDRLKIVCTLPEERLDMAFLEAAAERNTAAILGRRMTAALVLADLVQTANEYRLNDEKLLAATGELSRVIADRVNLPADDLLRLFLWPLEARRSALLPLLDRGTKGIPVFGLGSFVSKNIKRLANRDIELEALVLSERVHLGHALSATVFPARNEPEGHTALMNVIGDGLNFFRSFNTRIAAAWVGNEDRKAAGVSILPPIPLFEFETDIPIEEFESTVAFTSTRTKGRALFNRLAGMPNEEREEEISRLSEAMRRYSAKRDFLLSFENFDTAISLGALITGLAYPPVAGLKTLAQQLREFGRKNKLVDKLIQSVEADMLRSFGKNQDLDFLSRISRVAIFKKTRVS